MKRKFQLAAAAMASLALVALGMGAPAAFADADDQTKVNGESQEAANPALVNPDATVQLNIQKHLGGVTGGTADGTVQEVDRPKLQGVVFDVYKVEGVDLTTNAGWLAAAAAEDAQPNAELTQVVIGGVTHTLTKAGSVTTGADGIATFTQANGVGLYFVKENLAASTDITNITTGNKVLASTITPSSPFFVTLPMTHPTQLDSWMYDVRVYPKNQTDAIVKDIDDEQTYTLEEDITYTLTSTISPVAELGYYYLADDNEFITVESVSLSVKGDNTDVALTGCDGTGDGTGSCDYFYWLDADAAKAGSQLEIAFTASGLVKLQNAKAADDSAQVVTVINGTVLSVPASGMVPNTGSFIPSSDWYYNNGGETPVTPPTDKPNEPTDPQDPDVPGIPSNEVKSYFGNIKVDKLLVGGAAGDLPTGATFAVYVDPTPTTECTAADVSGEPLMTRSITEGSSVTFDPLRASNWANNEALADSSATGWIQYCVVETEAPTGYNLNAQPFTATIDWATGESTLTRTAKVEISNEKTNLGNELPLSGGEGIAALSLGGLLLIGGGAAYYAISSRKRREA